MGFEVFVYCSSCAPSKFLSQCSNDFHRANQQEVVRATTLSYRAGGVTDLFAAGLTLAEVMEHGRWETDTALIYYRDKNRLVFKVAYAFGTGKCMISGG